MAGLFGLFDEQERCGQYCSVLLPVGVTGKKLLKALFLHVFWTPISSQRIYDRAGEGFITMDTLRGLIGELLAPLTEEELDGIIEELDEDGSGTMDFDEFCEMMMSAPSN